MYNLHYLNFIFLFKKNDSKKIIEFWINNNQYSYKSVAWEIYPTSIRLINLIKWSKKYNIYTEKLSKLIFFHTNLVLFNFEYHLGGNHILTNYKSILFAFSYFQNTFNKKLTSKIEENFIKELKKQILKDGGHFESSPIYHNQIILDLLDILQLNFLKNRNKKKNL